MDPSDASPSTHDRRSFAKKAATVTGITAVGGLSTGVSTAQTDDGNGIPAENELFSCLVFRDDFRPFQEFIITSPVIDWTPRPAADLGSPFEGYNTRMIRYHGDGGNAPLFVADDVDLVPYDPELGYVNDDDRLADGQFVEPQVYAMRDRYAQHEATPELLEARFTPVEEDREDAVWDDDEDVEDDVDDGFFF